MIERAWDDGHGSPMNIAPRWRRGYVVPINQSAFVRKIYAVAHNAMRGWSSTDVVKGRRYFDWLSFSIDSHLTGRDADKCSLAGVQLKSRDESVKPSADDGPSRETVIFLCFASLCLLISAILLEYGLWNLYDGPNDWRATACVFGGWIPFATGIAIFFWVLN
jgi:hypothetical protein